MRASYGANMSKALQVIVWLAYRQPGIDFHKVLKLLFFADKYHINKYGRPIVGGAYRAGTYGPMCLPVYDLLRGHPLAIEMIESNGHVPFRVENRYRVYTQCDAQYEAMSPSDIEALAFALRAYGHMDFNELTKVSHDEYAYEAAEGGEMRYPDFLEESGDRDERAIDLAEYATFAAP